MALAAGVRPENFLSARERHGDDSFQGICEELLRKVEEKPPSPIFDALLIDEAQDLPLAFFRLAYYSAKTPKRIVWAYDELQNLGAYSMAPPEELFGSDPDGRPLVTLRNIAGEPHQDVILPVCYRNTKWALATAHALGFGIYREEGLCQFFQDPGLWNDIGYEVEQGDLASGEQVRLARRSDCSPKFFETYLDPADSVQAHVFANEDKQVQWIVKSIKENLAKDELEPDDIMVIFPDPLTVRKKASPLIAALTKSRIPAHIVGVTSSRDEVFVPDSIAISGIRRAKGNEAPMVYVANSDYCWGGPALIMKRNILFTAITRSRAWVSLSGCGDAMEKLRDEIKKVAGAGRLSSP
jgi:superfamily I DNA and RNA helicase